MRIHFEQQEPRSTAHLRLSLDERCQELLRLRTPPARAQKRVREAQARRRAWLFLLPFAQAPAPSEVRNKGVCVRPADAHLVRLQDSAVHRFELSAVRLNILPRAAGRAHRQPSLAPAGITAPARHVVRHQQMCTFVPFTLVVPTKLALQQATRCAHHSDAAASSVSALDAAMAENSPVNDCFLAPSARACSRSGLSKCTTCTRWPSITQEVVATSSALSAARRRRAQR